jgi:hypothetical protein
MKELIIELEARIADLKEAYIKEEKLKYEQQPHKDFNIGDFVTNGNKIGIVEWTENKDWGISYEQGYMNIDLDPFDPRNGISMHDTVRRDDWDKVEDPYYTNEYDVNLSLTGLEIERLRHTIHVFFSSPERREKTRELLHSFRKNES